jgi:hypothetical protein
MLLIVSGAFSRARGSMRISALAITAAENPGSSSSTMPASGR